MADLTQGMESEFAVRRRPVETLKGTCYVLFAYDVGLSIDLDEAERRIATTRQRGQLPHKRRAPQYFEYRPAPVRIGREVPPLAVGTFTTSPHVDVVLYDFGALSISYRIPFDGAFSQLQTLSDAVYENVLLQTESRRLVDGLLTMIGDTVERCEVSDVSEDYVIYQVQLPGVLPHDLLHPQRHAIASLLRSESVRLSDEEVREALSCRLSFGTDDAAVIDWNASLLIGDDMDDVQAVLEFANVELLEMRLLDQLLDDALDQAYDALTKRKARRFGIPALMDADLQRVAQLQVDHAILFERVTNTLKLIGDQFLARVYRAASQRFHLETWDANIHRKLQTLNSIYGKIADRASARRMEVLEWIIIVLIALSITVSFLPGMGGH